MVNENPFASILSESIKKRESSLIYRENLIAFSELLGFKNSAFHREVYTILQNLTLNFNLHNHLILAPRAHGKSTLGSSVYPLWFLVREPDARVIIIANTIQQAREWLRQIEQFMLYHQDFRENFGNLVPDPRTSTWTDTEKIIRGRSPFATHLSLLAIGFGGALLGRRADLLVVDDITDFETNLSEVGRTRAVAWFNETLMPVLEPSGKIIVLGTRFHEKDLYGYLLKTWGKSNCFVYQAIQPNGSALWPEKWSVEKLNEIKANIGSVFFSLQYQNIPLSDKDAIFKENWIRMATDIPSGLITFIGVDPCASPGPRSDYFAACVIGKHEKETYILDLILKRASLNEQIETIKHLNDFWKPARINIESNAFQILIPQLLADEGLPIHPSPTQESKQARFLRLSSRLETNKVFWKAEGGNIIPSLKPLLEQLLLYPNIEHDDSIDSLELGMQALFKVPPVLEVVNPPSSWYTPSSERPLFGKPRRRVLL